MKIDSSTINKCIYCGSEGVTDEHVIPYALGGNLILRKASCEPCRKITSKCERNPLKENWEEARAVLDYPSRRQNFSEKILPLKVELKDGTKKVLELRRNETIGLTPFLEYSLPAFFNPKTKYVSGVNVIASSMIGFGLRLEELKNKYNIKKISFTSNHKGNEFEIMVIKIAYCFVIAAWGIDCFNERFVLPTILREKDDAGYWMGCDPEGKIIPLIGKINSRNAIKIGIWQKAGDKNRYILVRIKFFAQSDSPEYIVVVGTLNSDFVISN